MAICIKRFGPVVRQLRQVSEAEYRKISKLYQFLTVLMSFGDRRPVRFQYQGRAAVRVTSVRDITERKQIEQRMIMIQKMQAIGTLAGGIAHDSHALDAEPDTVAHILQDRRFQRLSNAVGSSSPMPFFLKKESISS